jgi:hypothetical protein
VNPVQVNATCPLPGVAVTVPFAGAVESRMIDAEYGVASALPHLSLNHAYTVFVPLPLVSVQLFVVAYVTHDVQLVVLLMHICDTPLESLADNVSVTEVLFVAAAPELIVIEPTGELCTKFAVNASAPFIVILTGLEALLTAPLHELKL